jgi:hypothetical protein
MTYADRERKLITGNPLKSITWTATRKLKTVDPWCVINPEQARPFINTAGTLNDRGKRLKAFYGCLYYAALRPTTWPMSRWWPPPGQPRYMAARRRVRTRCFAG